MQKITYDSKSYINENASVPAANKVQAADMNEIKTVVNANADATHTWVELGQKKGTGSLTLPNDYRELLILFKLNDNDNAWLSMVLPYNMVSILEGTMGFNSGYWRSGNVGALGRVSVNPTTISLAQAYLNTVDVTSNTYIVVYYR